MTTAMHELGRRRRLELLPREIWASLAISMMWLAVVVDALFGPDIVTTDASGSGARIPSAVAVAFFAWLGTAAVARYGLDRRA